MLRSEVHNALMQRREALYNQMLDIDIQLARINKTRTELERELQGVNDAIDLLDTFDQED